MNRLNIGSDKGLAPNRCQAIIPTNAELLSVGLLGTNLGDILIKIQNVSFMKMYPKISSVKWRPFCLGLNVLTHLPLYRIYASMNRTNIGSDNGLAPNRCQAIILTNAELLSVGL